MAEPWYKVYQDVVDVDAPEHSDLPAVHPCSSAGSDPAFDSDDWMELCEFYKNNIWAETLDDIDVGTWFCQRSTSGAEIPPMSISQHSLAASPALLRTSLEFRRARMEAYDINVQLEVPPTVFVRRPLHDETNDGADGAPSYRKRPVRSRLASDTSQKWGLCDQRLCGKPLVPRVMPNGIVRLGCSGWRPNKRGCSFPTRALPPESHGQLPESIRKRSREKAATNALNMS